MILNTGRLLADNHLFQASSASLDYLHGGVLWLSPSSLFPYRSSTLSISASSNNIQLAGRDSRDIETLSSSLQGFFPGLSAPSAFQSLDENYMNKAKV